MATLTDPTAAWWFLDTLVVAHRTGSDSEPTILEQTLPIGAAPPLHRHEQMEDNWYVLDGTIVVRCGEERYVVTTGDFVRTPVGTPHQFRVVGERPARILEIHSNDDFYDFVRDLGSAATSVALPGPTAGPDIDALIAAAEAHDTSIVGPPMTEDEAQAVLAGSGR